jgi:RimJ/RimL family protein N-acetyltransferase
VITSDHSAGHWVARRTFGGYFEEKSRSLGLKKNGEFVAGVIYENFNRRSIMCHIAITGRMTPFFLFAIFDYPFNVCNVEKIIVPVTSNNLKSLKLVKKMGFAEEARLKDADPRGDIVLLTMLKEDCRFLGERYGKKCAIDTNTA